MNCPRCYAELRFIGYDGLVNDEMFVCPHCYAMWSKTYLKNKGGDKMPLKRINEEKPKGQRPDLTGQLVEIEGKPGMYRVALWFTKDGLKKLLE